MHLLIEIEILVKAKNGELLKSWVNDDDGDGLTEARNNEKVEQEKDTK